MKIRLTEDIVMRGGERILEGAVGRVSLGRVVFYGRDVVGLPPGEEPAYDLDWILSRPHEMVK